MRKAWSVAALAVFGLAFGGGKVNWLKYPEASAQSKATGTPVCVYSNVDAKGGGC